MSFNIALAIGTEVLIWATGGMAISSWSSHNLELSLLHAVHTASDLPCSSADMPPASSSSDAISARNDRDQLLATT